jgi:hypothetical protein
MSSFHTNENSMYYKYSSVWKNKTQNLTKVGIPFHQPISIQSGDKIYYISAEEEGRPDKLSNKFYGNVDLDWLICIANGIKDPLTELTAGKKIIIPEKSRFGF